MLTSSLTFEQPSPWSGSLRVGLRAQLSRSAFADASATYLSFGQNDLDVWDGRVALNWLF